MTVYFSGGTLYSTFTKSRPQSWSGTTDHIPGWLIEGMASYSAMYERQPWVATVIDKLAVSHARLPYKVYRRDGDNDRTRSDGPFAQLMRQPCKYMSNFQLWQWTTSTENIHGNAFWVKERDAADRPVAVHPRHPSRIIYDNDEGRWWLLDARGQRERTVARIDIVHFRSYSPGETAAGMSPLEPLRSTLENEEGARRANSAMWRNGGRPGTVLKHPGKLSDAAGQRLKGQWEGLFRGVDNWAKTVVMEEGMEPAFIPLNLEELTYIESRRLNREEVCARFDVPPPVVHILDRATYSNITEQMRSMYRDTMGWRVGRLEDTIDAELRDGSMGQFEPDFDEVEYGRFNMDEVLRGAFEERAAAINASDFMTIAEKRALMDLPFIEGTDQIMLNSATLPLGRDGRLVEPAQNTVDVRSLMGRLGRVESCDGIDVRALTEGLPEPLALRVAATVALADTDDITELRAAVRAAVEES